MNGKYYTTIGDMNMTYGNYFPVINNACVTNFTSNSKYNITSMISCNGVCTINGVVHIDGSSDLVTVDESKIIPIESVTIKQRIDSIDMSNADVELNGNTLKFNKPMCIFVKDGTLEIKESNVVIGNVNGIKKIKRSSETKFYEQTFYNSVILETELNEISLNCNNAKFTGTIDTVLSIRATYSSNIRLTVNNVHTIDSSYSSLVDITSTTNTSATINASYSGSVTFTCATATFVTANSSYSGNITVNTPNATVSAVASYSGLVYSNGKKTIKNATYNGRVMYY